MGHGIELIENDVEIDCFSYAAVTCFVWAAHMRSPAAVQRTCHLPVFCL